MWFILVLIVIFISICAQSITNLDIFTLGYILSYSIGYDLAYIDPFLADVSILYTMKTPGKQKASSVFRGYEMGIMARNGLIKFVTPRWGPA